jgi:hypothetical protein
MITPAPPFARFLLTLGGEFSAVAGGLHGPASGAEITGRSMCRPAASDSRRRGEIPHHVELGNLPTLPPGPEFPPHGEISLQVAVMAGSPSRAHTSGHGGPHGGPRVDLGG